MTRAADDGGWLDPELRPIIFRIGAIAVLVIGAFLFRAFLPGNWGDLAVGDCFDLPLEVDAIVEDVQHRPCTDSHTAEVVYEGSYVAINDDGVVEQGAPTTYPSDGAFQAFLESWCTVAFNAYTGLDSMTDPTYDMGAFTPSEEGWRSGDRKVICYAVRIDGASMTQSIRKT